MKRIDRETVRRINDATDIVDVVSDFVTLKRRGANYIGLCPFHNERTPSFSVSKSRRIFKCFSCGEGGSAISFLMKLEQMSYNEALRYLAKKYNIEIIEHEMTDAERQAESLRESLLAVNDFALKHFEYNMSQTEQGRLIGLSYFRERGINDQMIQRFHLGYALDRSDDLYNAAIKAGYEEKYLVDTGLCTRTDQGRVYDRFKGRVIYPVHTVSGKVVAFGGRTLRKDKNVAKYVNSPESSIYHKSVELYGLYQAKQAIVKADKCILVEGYMDVISMHQVGVENVVASSGTSLTKQQVRLIHRFTENVTVIYDSDAAGIKASLRGIDLLLAEGLNIKVLQLPEGDDPDSFAQSHSSAEVLEYIKANEVDFIRFKTRILLADAADDPIVRSRVISDIVRSISMIPVEMTRETYIRECSRMLDIDERTLKAQLHRETTRRTEEILKERQQEQARASLGDIDQKPETADPSTAPTDQTQQIDVQAPAPGVESHQKVEKGPLDMFEREILRYVVKYGMMTIGVDIEGDGNTSQVKVIDYVLQEFNFDDIHFTNPLYADTFAEALRISRGSWDEDHQLNATEIEKFKKKSMTDGVDEIRRSGTDVSDIERREKALTESIEAECDRKAEDFAATYISGFLINSPSDSVRNITSDLLIERHQLSAIYQKTTHVVSERERLATLVPSAIYALKYGMLRRINNDLMQQIKMAAAAGDNDKVEQLMKRVQMNNEIKARLAHTLGERIVTP